MRKLNFMKIDYIRFRSHLWTSFLFPVVAGLFLMLTDEANGAFAVFFSLFGAIIFSSLPYCMEKRSNHGFLHMLPAKSGDFVAGHYLFSLSLIIYCFLAALIVGQVCHLLRPSILFSIEPYYLILAGIAILVVGIQNLVLSAFSPEVSAQVMNILRILPGFIFYFGLLQFVSMMKKWPDLIARMIALATPLNCTLVLLACLLLFIGMMQISSQITSRRDCN